MTAVSGPWDGAAFGSERINLSNGYESEYRFEYPVKTIQRTMSKLSCRRSLYLQIKTTNIIFLLMT